MATNSSRAPGSEKTYYLLPVWRSLAYIFPFIGVIFAAGMAWVLAGNPGPPELGFLLVAVLGTVLLLGLGLFVYFGVRRMSLVTTPEGLAYYSLGYTIRASWAQVTGFGEAPTQTTAVKGLLLREPAVEVDPWLRAGQWLQPLFLLVSLLVPHTTANVHPADIPPVIPIASFAADWRQGPLGDELCRYAPQLFTARATPP